jgi:hypothetical protein
MESVKDQWEVIFRDTWTVVNDREPPPLNLHADRDIALIELRSVFDEIRDRPFNADKGRKHHGFGADLLPNFHDHRSIPPPTNTRSYSASRLSKQKLLRCLISKFARCNRY